MLFKIYAKVFSVWFLSTISTAILVPIILFSVLFPIVVTIAGFVDLELDFSAFLPSWWLLAAIPLAALSYLLGLALAPAANVSLFITCKVGMMMLWVPPVLLLLWFLGIFNPSAFEDACDKIVDKLDELNFSDMISEAI